MKKLWITLAALAMIPVSLATDTINKGFFVELDQVSKANDYGIVVALVLLLLLLLYKALLEGR